VVLGLIAVLHHDTADNWFNVNGAAAVRRSGSPSRIYSGRTYRVLEWPHTLRISSSLSDQDLPQPGLQRCGPRPKRRLLRMTADLVSQALARRRCPPAEHRAVRWWFTSPRRGPRQQGLHVQAPKSGQPAVCRGNTTQSWSRDQGLASTREGRDSRRCEAPGPARWIL